MSTSDAYFMRLALAEARRAAEQGDVPVGAVVVRAEHVVAADHNRKEAAQDPTAHAEMLAIRSAAEELGSWRLEDSTLYVTMEPCPMCAGALWSARVQRLVYAAPDERAGAAGSLYNVVADSRLNHRLEVCGGVLAEEAQAMLQAFFRDLRAKSRAGKQQG